MDPQQQPTPQAPIVIRLLTQSETAGTELSMGNSN